MASIEFITKRIAGKEKEIARLTAKIERIEAAKATNWEKNPYFYSESDLRWANQDLAAAQEGLAKYQSELADAQVKADCRNVPAILEFLDAWKTRCKQYFGDGLQAAFTERDALRTLEKQACECGWGTDEYYRLTAQAAERRKEYNRKLRGTYELQKCILPTGHQQNTEVKVKDGEWEYLVPYMRSTYAESMTRLCKILDDEANRKYDFIIERTTAIVGKITDASHLSVGSKGDLNGWIIGTKGKACVKTIGAGGYNIQCFHFRTLINRIK